MPTDNQNSAEDSQKTADAQRPEPFFVCDHSALDFLSTFTAPWGTHIEWIANGQDLLDWLCQAELITESVKAHFLITFSTQQLDEVAAEARSLREWFREFIVNHAEPSRKSIAVAELQRINEILVQDRQHKLLIENPQGEPQWQYQRDWGQASTLLLPLAEVLGDLVCNTELSQVRNCEGPTCNLYFVDVSKNKKRRWCTMSVCGNRAKAAAHRARRKGKT